MIKHFGARILDGKQLHYSMKDIYILSTEREEYLNEKLKSLKNSNKIFVWTWYPYSKDLFKSLKDNFPPLETNTQTAKKIYIKAICSIPRKWKQYLTML